MMKAAGIDMLDPEAGIATVRRELIAGPPVGEIVGGLDLRAVAAEGQGPMIGRVTKLGLYSGLTVETELDPDRQAFLYDHKIDGTPVLPGVMGVEGFAELSAMLLPGWRAESIEDIRFMEPFKFYRGQPRTVRMTARLEGNGKGLIARCSLVGERMLKGRTEPLVATSFTARVHLGQGESEDVRIDKPAAARGAVLEAGDVYDVYFHGPAYQVLDSAWGDGPGTVIGKLADSLPDNHEPPELPTRMAPRLIELCFQTAGMYELGVEDRYGLPSRISMVQKLRDVDSTDRPLYSVVRHHGNGKGFDAEVVDEHGGVYMRLRDYRTAELPGAAAAVRTEPIKAVFSAD